MIKQITRIYTRTYTDSGQQTTYVEWQDKRGKAGRTEGIAGNPHMAALISRGEREGLKRQFESW